MNLDDEWHQPYPGKVDFCYCDYNELGVVITLCKFHHELAMEEE